MGRLVRAADAASRCHGKAFSRRRGRTTRRRSQSSQRRGRGAARWRRRNPPKWKYLPLLGRSPIIRKCSPGGKHFAAFLPLVGLHARRTRTFLTIPKSWRSRTSLSGGRSLVFRRTSPQYGELAASHHQCPSRSWRRGREFRTSGDIAWDRKPAASRESTGKSPFAEFGNTSRTGKCQSAGRD